MQRIRPKTILVRFCELVACCIMCSTVGIPARAEPLQTREELRVKAEAMFGEPRNATRLVQDGLVWVDAKRGLVIVDGYVTLRKGQLEMFACPTGTKEHESVVAVFSAARHVHAGLLAAGAEQGAPTQFEPYKPARGTTIKISALYKDPEGKNKVATAQSWVRSLNTKKEMNFDWVFSGSGFYKDVDTGEQRYLGDTGDFICVANFPTATLDLAVESVAANSGLTFEAFTENIPPVYTIVRLVLKVSDEEPRRSMDEDPAIVVPPATIDSQKKDASNKATEAKNDLDGMKDSTSQKGDLAGKSEKQGTNSTGKPDASTPGGERKNPEPKGGSKPPKNQKPNSDSEFNVDELFESLDRKKEIKK